MDERDLNPEHAHVLNEVRRSLNDTIGPMREEMRVGFATQSVKLESLQQRLDANDEATQRIGIKVDHCAERISSIEGAQHAEAGEGVSKAKVGFYTALTGLVTAAGAWLSGVFGQPS